MRHSDSKRVASNLRAELARIPMSGRELARRTGDVPATMTRWISGESAISAAKLAQIAQIIDVPIDVLVQGVSAPIQADDAAEPERMPA